MYSTACVSYIIYPISFKIECRSLSFAKNRAKKLTHKTLSSTKLYSLIQTKSSRYGAMNWWFITQYWERHFANTLIDCWLSPVFVCAPQIRIFQTELTGWTRSTSGQSVFAKHNIRRVTRPWLAPVFHKKHLNLWLYCMLGIIVTISNDFFRPVSELRPWRNGGSTCYVSSHLPWGNKELLDVKDANIHPVCVRWISK